MKSPDFWLSVWVCLLLGASAGLCADTPPVAPTPPEAVTPDFGRLGNVFFVGDTVSVKLKGTGATRYEVRNYDGKVVDSGDVADPLTPKVTDPGWYKFYLNKGTGVDDGVGSATFVVLRHDTNFPDPPTTPSEQAMRGEYFSGENFNAKFLTRTDADDGVRLWIDGKLLVNNWSDHANSENGGKIALQANRVYSIQMEYYENGQGDAGIKLGRVSPSQERQIIPSTRLSSPPVAHLAPPPPKHPAKTKPKPRHKR